MPQINNGYEHGYGSPSQQWAAAFQPWSSQVISDAKSPNDPNVSAAWAAYYQQYYGQVGGAAQSDSNSQGAASAAQPTINPQTGQPDYSQAWVQYYRSLGMHEQADAILRQTQVKSFIIKLKYKLKDYIKYLRIKIMEIQILRVVHLQPNKLNRALQMHKQMEMDMEVSQAIKICLMFLFLCL